MYLPTFKLSESRPVVGITSNTREKFFLKNRLNLF